MLNLKIAEFTNFGTNKNLYLKSQCRLYEKNSYDYRTIFYDLHAQLLTPFTHQIFANQIHLQSLVFLQTLGWYSYGEPFSQKITKKLRPV